MELLKEIAPAVRGSLFPFNPATAPTAEYYLNSFKATPASFAMEVKVSPRSGQVASSNRSSQRMPARRMAACLGPGRLLQRDRTDIASLAARYRYLPSIPSATSLKPVVCCLMERT